MPTIELLDACSAMIIIKAVHLRKVAMIAIFDLRCFSPVHRYPPWRSKMKKFARILAPVALTVAVAAAHAEENLTYTKDVAPIFHAKCLSCHREGEIAPFSMMDYATIRPWAKSIRKVVIEKTMPPWHADSSKTEFLNDRSLTQDEIDTISHWVGQGAKQGNPKDLPTTPVFHDTWAMGEPDFIFHADRDFVVPALAGKIRYQSIHFGPVLDEDIYITEWEIRPTERASVHHANLVRAPKRLERVSIGPAVMAGGDYIGSYLPGSRPFSYPEGTALKIPKGQTIQIQVHYVGLEEEVTDHLMFGVKLAQGRIDKVVRTIGTDDNSMVIEPNDPSYPMDAEITLNYPLTILSSGAHMHLRGSSYNASLLLPDGTEKLVTDVPKYDFNWQSNYELANPVSVPKGTKYKIHATFDNSSDNPYNPDPSQEVRYGPWTNDEMLVTWSHVLLTEEKLGHKMKDGRIVGRFEDGVATRQPPLLQSLPAGMAP